MTPTATAPALSPSEASARLRVAPDAARPAHVISMANQKGGVAKTTSTVNLSAALKERGKRVLAIDLDPQSNLTMSFGINPETLGKSMFDVLVHREPIANVVHQREVDVAAASIDLAGAELALASAIGGCVSVNAPDKPIDINLNVTIRQEVLVRLERDVETLINQNPEAFPQPQQPR